MSNFQDPFGFSLSPDQTLPRFRPAQPPGALAIEDRNGMALGPAERFLPYWGVNDPRIAQTPGQRPFNLGLWTSHLRPIWDEQTNGAMEAFVTCEPTIVAWICRKRHRYLLPLNVAMGEFGCVVCNAASLARPRLGKTPKTVADFPDARDDWNFEANWPLRPEHVMASSSSFLDYRCRRCGVGWNTYTRTRTSRTRCPRCAGCVSRKETMLWAALRFLMGDSVDRQVVVPGWAGGVDIVVRSHRIAIEYDGGYDHAHSSERDLRKNAAIEAAGLVVLRVREQPLPPLGTHSINVSSSLGAAKLVYATCTALRTLDTTIPKVSAAGCSQAVQVSAALVEQTLQESGYWLRKSSGRGRR